MNFVNKLRQFVKESPFVFLSFILITFFGGVIGLVIWLYGDFRFLLDGDYPKNLFPIIITTSLIRIGIVVYGIAMVIEVINNTSNLLKIRMYLLFILIAPIIKELPVFIRKRCLNHTVAMREL